MLKSTVLRLLLPPVLFGFIALFHGLLTGHASAVVEAPNADFFVSTQGNDNWSGRIPAPNEKKSDGPFRTFARAIDAVRKIRKQSGSTIEVLIRGGFYELEETLFFTPEDSASQAAPTVYAAYPGEKPVISGGRRLFGWKKDIAGRWTTTIQEVQQGKWYTRQFFINGERRPRARIPDTGFLRSAGPPRFSQEDHEDIKEKFGENLAFSHFGQSGKFGFRYKDNDIKPWSNLHDVTLHTMHAWTSAIHWIASLNEIRRVVRFTGPSRFPSSHFEKQMPYYIENVMEGLDSTGEWYLNRSSGVLTYLPKEGENLAEVTSVVSVLDRLVSICGDAQKKHFVEGLIFRGLSFQYADWGPLDRKKENDGYGAVNFLPAAIMANGARYCEFKQCEFTRNGAYALYMIDGSAFNHVEQCQIHDMGGGGILIGSRWSPYDTFKKVLPSDNAPDHIISRSNVVNNCFIHGCGKIFHGILGVLVAHSPYNKIVHNEICDMPYSGICVGRRLDDKYSHAHHNEIAYNHIHHLGDGVMSDMGGVYTEGRSPGTRIHHNYIHDIRRYRYGAWGLYCDQNSSGIQLDHNICLRCEDGGFMQNVGGLNLLSNNILAYHDDSGMLNSGRTPGDAFDSIVVENNIIVTNKGQILGYFWDESDQYLFDFNIYWKPQNMELEFAKKTWEQWRESGQDTHSVISDPMFVNLEGGDFRFKAGAPVEKIGFEPIEITQVGLYGDPGWVQKPRALTFDPFERVDPPDKVFLASLQEDFEDLIPGDPIEDAQIHGNTQHSFITVTDRFAAKGKHSLLLKDAAGLPKPNWPWIAFNQIKCTEGSARLSFYVRLEEDAFLWHEWRNKELHYNVGPSIKIHDGKLFVMGKGVASIPFDTWIRLEINCPLGEKSNGQYDMAITVPGQFPLHLKNLPCQSGEDFTQFEWVGFMSQGQKESFLYIDDIEFNCVRM